MGSIELQIDPEFKHLIRPLQRKEYLQLESNLLADGCLDPIITWHGFIVDGHNRYEICRRHNIPFRILEKDFDCREAVIAWICANQLGRRNISEETRKFLIGMQYESEKVVNSKRNARGLNQYSEEDNPGGSEPAGSKDIDLSQKHITAERIAMENHISNGTVQKYASYTRALEEIGRKEPEIVPKILSGQFKISHNNILELSKRSAEEIRKVNRKMDHSQVPFIQYKKTRNAIKHGKYDPVEEDIETLPSVKDMPEYDPDAEITGLTLTIPSWASSIERAMKNSDLKQISSQARINLSLALYDLQGKFSTILSAIRGDD